MTRQLLKITGKDATHFLQGLITNDIGKLDQGMVYAALLTPQGKFIVDFFLSRGCRDDKDAILLDVNAAFGDMLAQKLTMYRLRADVKIEKCDLEVERGVGERPRDAFADPRHSALGWRRYSRTAAQDKTDWDALRVAHCIPETGIELTGDTFILEAGFERLNGVDFRKGCYVGQEITARMKHKTNLRKGLALVALEAPVAVGTDIVAKDKPVGTVFTQSNGQGIAYLRFDRAISATDSATDVKDATDALEAKGTMTADGVALVRL